MPPLRVLINGGGIAGNALGLLLAQQGHAVTIVERFSTLRASGLQVDLRGFGIEVLKRMGLEADFLAHAAPEQGMQVVDKHGQCRAFFPVSEESTPKADKYQNFTSQYEIMRGDFVRLLHGRARSAGAEHHFGLSARCLAQRDDKVIVQLGERTIEYDLMIGADGVQSRTRRDLLRALPTGGETPAEAFHPIRGIYIAYFTAPIPLEKHERYAATMYMAPGSRGIMTRRHDPHSLQVYAGGRSSTNELDLVARGDTKREKAVIRSLLSGAGWRTEALLDAMDQSDDFYCERIGLVKLPTWSSGRVVLVGDAAWCPSVNSGMGTTCALVGAYILAGEIGKYARADCDESRESAPATNSLATALAAYEANFRPFMQQVQEGLLEESNLGMPSSRFGIEVFYLLAAVAALFKVNVGKMMMKEKVRNWNLPIDYASDVRR